MVRNIVSHLVALSTFALGGAMFSAIILGIYSFWGHPNWLWVLWGALAAFIVGIPMLIVANWMYYSMSRQYESMVHPSNDSSL